MITQNKQMQFVGGIPPFSPSFSPSLSCLSVSSFSLLNNVLNFTIQGEESCFNTNPTITISGFDSVGCPFEEELALTNPCTDFVVSEISNNGLTFSISATSQCGEAEFVWDFPETYSIVTQIDTATTSQLTLQPLRGNTLPSQDLISCTVTSCEGCVRVKELLRSECAPVTSNIFAQAFCTSNNTWETPFITIPVTNSCAGIIYADTQFATPSAVTATLSNNRVKFTVTPTAIPLSQYIFNYTVKANNGVQSNVATVTININPCEELQVNGISEAQELVATVTSGDVILTDITNRFISANPINWSTFDILPNITYTSPSITLQTAIDGSQNLRYVVPATPVTESVQFTVADTQGNVSNPVTQTYVLRTDTTTINNISTCVIKGNTIVTNALSTSTGTFDINSFRITTPPTLGTYTLNGTTITYTAPTAYSGNQVFTYSINDVYGGTYTGTVTYAVINAGTSVTLSTCSDGTYNLLSLLGQGVNTTGSWAAIGGAWPTPASYNADISLTGLTGTFEWEYTVTAGACSTKAIVIINKVAASAQTADECATAPAFTAITATPYSNTISASFVELCPTYQKATLSAAALPLHWTNVQSDIWYKINLSAVSASVNPLVVRISSSNAGLFLPAEFVQFGLYTTCGGALQTSVNSVTRNSSYSEIVLPDGSIPAQLLFRVGATTPGNTNLVLTINNQALGA